MSKSRKERREAAAKAARTIKPVAVVGSVEDKLRNAYVQVEELEADKSYLADHIKNLSDDYDDLEQKSHQRIGQLEGRTINVGVTCATVGVVLGALLSLLPW